jgi:hypothetical protein
MNRMSDKQQTLFLMVLPAGKSKIKVTADLMSGEGHSRFSIDGRKSQNTHPLIESSVPHQG